MRRTLAILLTLFFSLGPLATTLRAVDESSLPVCCRTHGAHHCVMNERSAERATTGAYGSTHFFAAPSHCPLYPCGTLAPSTSSHALAITFAGILPFQAQDAPLLCEQSFPSCASFPSLTVRGPPALS